MLYFLIATLIFTCLAKCICSNKSMSRTMSRISGASAYITTLSFAIGILAQLTEYRFANAEVKLIGSSEVPMIGSPFELECSFIGPQVVTGFEMLLNNVSVMSALFNCRVLLEPNKSLYDYNCSSETQLNLIINDVTRDIDGDNWSCTVFLSKYFESATYTIFVYDNWELTTEVMSPTNATLAKLEGKKQTTLGTTEIYHGKDNRELTTEALTSTNATLTKTGNTTEQDDKTAIIFGVALGTFSITLCVFSVVFTLLLNGRKSQNDTKPRDHGVRRTANLNIGHNSNDSAEQSCTNTSARDDPKKGTETRV